MSKGLHTCTEHCMACLASQEPIKVSILKELPPKGGRGNKAVSSHSCKATEACALQAKGMA